MPNALPFVAAAFVCERVLEEKDKVLSAIRIVDTYYLAQPSLGLPANAAPLVQLTVLASVKSGDVIGEHEITIALRTPSGKGDKQIGQWNVLLNGGEQGANVIMNFAMQASDLGLYWFDLAFAGKLLTSIPLKLARLAD
jgi:hypothetical protein